MDQNTLAQELRHQLHHLHERLDREPNAWAARVSDAEIDVLSDEAIIQSYTACSCCGEQRLTPQERQGVVGLARTAQHFCALADDVIAREVLRAIEREMREQPPPTEEEEDFDA
jgi:hypothetical protein